jgi:hypothetical protein
VVSRTPADCWRIRASTWIVVALLALYAALALSASTRMGVSYDEGEEIAVGYDIWLRHDYRMETANGDLVKRWATLPLLIARPNFPSTDDPDWRGGRPYTLGYKFLFESGNRAERLLFLTRSMVTVLGIALGLIVFLCSRELFGIPGGLLSLGLYVFSPHFLAFGGMVSTEVSTCLGLLGASWFVWRLLFRVTWVNLLGSLLFVALAFLAKLSALLLIPMTVIMVAIRLIYGGPLAWELGKRRLVRSVFRQSVIYFGLFVAHAVLVWAVIWAAYGFRYVASPMPADPGVIFQPQDVVDPIEPINLKFIAWCRAVHFLPEGFLFGVKWLLGQNDMRQSFMNGRWTIGGWRTFFPYAIWAKTPPALFLILPFGLAVWWWTRRKENSPTAALATAPPFYATIPFVVLAVVYLLVAIVQNIDIGHRHVLPIYPPLYILAGSAGLVFCSGRLIPRLLVGGLALASAANSIAVYPDFLAYFSPVVGGPARGYLHLVDSSLDWGMGLPELKRWLVQNNPGDRDQLYLGYFGVGDPDYDKIKYHWLFGEPGIALHDFSFMQPGIYAISATALQTVGTLTYGPWNPVYESAYWTYTSQVRELLRTKSKFGANGKWNLSQQPASEIGMILNYEQLAFGRLCAWLRHHRPPDAEVGYSILIWRLSADDLRAALGGPPSELTDSPFLRRAN